MVPVVSINVEAVDPQHVNSSSSSSNNHTPFFMTTSSGINAADAMVLEDIEREEVRERSQTALPGLHSILEDAASTVTGPSNLNVDMQSQYSAFAVDDELLASYGCSSGIAYWYTVFADSFTERAQFRTKLYTGYLLGVFACFASGILDTNHFAEWMLFWACSTGIEFCSALVDSMFFCILDNSLRANFKVAYILKSFNGPMSWLLTAFGVQTLLNRKIPYVTENLFVPYFSESSVSERSSVTIIFILFVIKQYAERINYTNLLELRFAERLLQLDLWTVVLSELASTKPPTTTSDEMQKHDKANGDKTSDGGMRLESSLRSAAGSASTSSKAKTKVRDAFAAVVASTSAFGNQISRHLGEGDNLYTAKKSSSLRNHFGLGADTASSSGIRGRARSTSNEGRPGSATDENGVYSSGTWSFWESAYRLSGHYGSLQLQTYNGEAWIRKRRHATNFGKSLYNHLSKGGKVKVTHMVIHSLLMKAREGWSNNSAIDGDGGDAATNNAIAEDDERASCGLLNVNRLFEEAVKLVDPSNIGVVTEDSCVNAICEAYKRHRYAAESLNGFGELHASLRTIIAVLFWIGIVVISQVFLDVEITSSLFPFLTIGFSAGFLLGPLVQSILLDVVFVLSMKPFDIGHRIKVNFGYNGGDTNDCEGMVRSVSLFYTVINTEENHVVRVPNHKLFHSNIQNDGEFNLGVRYAFHVTFTSTADKVLLESDVANYMEKVKDFVSFRKDEWISMATYATSVGHDNIVYMLEVVHKQSYINQHKARMSRTALLTYINSLNQKMYLTK
jgi:hypothetical protein